MVKVERIVRVVRVVAGIARAKAEVAKMEAWRLKPAGWPGG